MKNKFITLGAILMCAVLSLTACGNNGSTASASTTTASETTTEEPAVTTDANGMVEVEDSTEPDKLTQLMNAKVRDEIKFNDYRIFQMDTGTEVFFANGKYVFTVNDLVVETREAVTVAKPSATIRDVLLGDADFDVAKCTPHFYNASGENVVRDLDTVLDETATQCIAEYVDWRTDEDGILKSYIFSYKDAPVKITAIYTKSMEEESNDTAETTDAESSENPEETKESSDDNAAETTAAETSKPETTTTVKATTTAAETSKPETTKVTKTTTSAETTTASD